LSGRKPTRQIDGLLGVPLQGYARLLPFHKDRRAGIRQCAKPVHSNGRRMDQYPAVHFSFVRQCCCNARPKPAGLCGWVQTSVADWRREKFNSPRTSWVQASAVPAGIATAWSRTGWGFALYDKSVSAESSRHQTARFQKRIHLLGLYSCPQCGHVALVGVGPVKKC
jgi:hypothetical protein